MCQVKRQNIYAMGLSVRTEQWRYTEWLTWNGQNLTVEWQNVLGVELYQHANDDEQDFDEFENVNVAHQSQYSDIVKAHHAMLLKQFSK